MGRDSSGAPVVKVANSVGGAEHTCRPSLQEAEAVLGNQGLAGATKKFLSQSNSNDGRDRQECFGLYTTSLSQRAFS